MVGEVSDNKKGQKPRQKCQNSAPVNNLILSRRLLPGMSRSRFYITCNQDRIIPLSRRNNKKGIRCQPGWSLLNHRPDLFQHDGQRHRNEADNGSDGEGELVALGHVKDLTAHPGPESPTHGGTKNGHPD